MPKKQKSVKYLLTRPSNYGILLIKFQIVIAMKRRVSKKRMLQRVSVRCKEMLKFLPKMALEQTGRIYLNRPGVPVTALEYSRILFRVLEEVHYVSNE